MPAGIVIPCYNEGARLDESEVRKLVEANVDVYLMDDGSTDDTLNVLKGLEVSCPDNVSVISFVENVGKGEAVRHGLLRAIEAGSSPVGYLDADFATSADEMSRLIARFSEEGVNVLLGSRWLHLGAEIKRNAVRHYLGRVFATFTSMILRMPVYDTQCGAKLFATSEVLANSLAAPFISRWAFDVELLGRMKKYGYSNDDFYEEPLQRWIDVAGSKVKLTDMLKVAVDLFRLWRMQR
ncbi:MAG TPA: family 2 glycosyl transferase, partial [Gammaproteobacteria bacterium]|nr:family 2 glycosyl transferase [Gammaproteobacteria bacterium]